MEAVAITDPFELQLADFQERWFGSPALWQPPASAATEIRYFDISGTTQADLIRSLNEAALCSHYKCLPDPGAPSGEAWGLAGTQVAASFCYVPRTATRSIETFILMPRWLPQPYGGVKRALVQKWNALEQVIYTHEATHVGIAVGDITALIAQSQQVRTCDDWVAFWSRPSLFDQLDADQNAFHAQLRADCRPEVGCMPAGWMGW